jgi:hypothetical protein
MDYPTPLRICLLLVRMSKLYTGEAAQYLESSWNNERVIIAMVESA